MSESNGHVSPSGRSAVVDLGAITSNVARLRSLSAAPHAMAVVKANGYGHGSVPVARAALRGGADWIGVATIEEALALRDGGIEAPVIAWLHDSLAVFPDAVRRSIEIGVSNREQLEAAAAAARDSERRAVVQLKLDTGLSRNGVAPSEWRAIMQAASSYEQDGLLSVTGIFSHLANASESADASAFAAFDSAIDAAREAGLRPELIHLASTAAGVSRPLGRCTMVRWGIGIYGLSPSSELPAHGLGLRPAMTLLAPVAAVRRVPAGTGVSYDYAYTTGRPTTLALVPLGYADGIPRQASGRAEVTLNGRRYPVRGRIAMDQFVIEVGDDEVQVGEQVTVFGDAQTGVPAAEEWADAAGTINYDVVTRVGSRVTRHYVDEEPPPLP